MIKAVFLDRDGVLNHDTDLIHRVEDFHLYPYTAAALKLLEAAGFLRLVITNQSAVARGLMTEAYLNNTIHQSMHEELANAGAAVNRIYYCPHHPEGNFVNAQTQYIKICNCRKPATGMLEQALRDFPIDLPQSWLIGDSTRDIQAGRTLGLRTIGVKTGHGKAHFPHQIAPDYLVNDFLEAAQLIVALQEPEPA